MKNRIMNSRENISQTKQRFSIRKYKKAASAVMIGMFLTFGFSFSTEASEKDKENVDQVQEEEQTNSKAENEEEATTEAELTEQEEALLVEQEHAEMLISELVNISDENKAYYIGEIEASTDIETVQLILEEALVEDEAIYQETLKEEEALKAEEERLKAEEEAQKQAEEEAAQAEKEKAEQEAKEQAEQEQEEQEKAEQKEAERKAKEAAEAKKAEEEAAQKEQAEDDEETKEDVEENKEDETEFDEETDSENSTDNSVGEEAVEEELNQDDETEESTEPVEEQPEVVEEEVPEELTEQTEEPEEPVTEPVQPEKEIVEQSPEYVEPEQPVEEDIEVTEQAPVNFQKGVSDAYQNAEDKAQLEAHLTDVVNTSFKMRDSEAFMKSLDVNVEDLTPEEFTYMLIKHLSENVDAKNIVVTRDDNDDVLTVEGTKDLSPDFNQAKVDSKNNLSLMFYLDDERKALYLNQIDQAKSHEQLNAIVMVANAYNYMNTPDYVAYGNYPSQDTKSILNNDTEITSSVKSLALNNESLSEINELNYIPFELTSESVGNEGSYTLQLQLDERLAQYVTAMTAHGHESYITKLFKRVVNDVGQLTNIWQIDYDRLFNSEDDTFMTAKNGLIMLEDTISNIESHYDDLETNPLFYQTAVINEKTGQIVESTKTRAYL